MQMTEYAGSVEPNKMASLKTKRNLPLASRDKLEQADKLLACHDTFQKFVTA